MSYPIEEKLVIAVSSSAVFDLRESDRVFRKEGSESYRNYTLSHESIPFQKGAAFSFVKRLLSINHPEHEFEPIEVILISKNDADTGQRVLNSLKHYKLNIVRSAFTCGGSPSPYISALNASLFLSNNEEDVTDAIKNDMPAGTILSPSKEQSDTLDQDQELKIAFDFDGILADDSSEQIYQSQGLNKFQDHEKKFAEQPMSPGPLMPLLKKISLIQKSETEKQDRDKSYKPKIRTALITSRSSPAHERVVQTLRHWGIQMNEAFFLGGISKERILSVFKPQIFFDDQKKHLITATISMAMVHVPYGDFNKEL